MIVVKRTDVCGFRHWICGEHLILLVNDVFKPGFGDTLIRFEVFSTFDRWNLHFGGLDVFQVVNIEFLHVFIQIYCVDLEYDLF